VLTASLKQVSDPGFVRYSALKHLIQGRAPQNMYIHTFLFQWQPTVTEEMKVRAEQEIRALQGQIPGLLETSYGANVSPRSQGFTHGGVMKFRDKAALDSYTPHPVHQRLVEWLMPLLKLAAELDYEV
jgi:Stress responsive A/B Barrel Domain